MPRRSLLTPADRTGLLAFPTTDDDRVRHYTFSEPDLSVIRQRRGKVFSNSGMSLKEGRSRGGSETG